MKLNKFTSQLVLETQLLLFILLFSMCSHGKAYYVENTGHPTLDSLKLHCVDTIVINIGDRIKPIPSSSQIVKFDSITGYAILDENRVTIFDIRKDSQIATISLEKCGLLNNYSGFSLLNNDSLFVYNYNEKKLFLTDMEGNVLQSQALPKEVVKDVAPEALSCTPAIHVGDRIIISGIPVSHSTSSKEQPISVAWDYVNDKIDKGASFCDEYTKGYFGGIYYNTIYQCNADNNTIVYSFPASNHIYRYDKKLSFVDSIYMGSRYTHEIASETKGIKDFLLDKDGRLDYYLKQDSYENILYNTKDSIYFRIACHPLESTESEKQRKPFSIIVMTHDGNLITETPILNKDMSLIPFNSHVYMNGLIIQIESDDENVIKFAHFKLN